MGLKSNQVILIGKVGSYKEMKYFEETGGCVCTINVGHKRGEKWHNFFVKFYNKIAEEVGEYIREGANIQIIGRLVENVFIPKGWEGQLDEKGEQKTVSHPLLVGHAIKKVQWNVEDEEWEEIGG